MNKNYIWRKSEVAKLAEEIKATKNSDYAYLANFLKTKTAN
jgi:hypothetical protein